MFHIRRWTIFSILTVTVGTTCIDETSFVQTAASLHMRNHAASIHSYRQPTEEVENPVDLDSAGNTTDARNMTEESINQAWKDGNVKGLKIGNIIGFKLIYYWGQKSLSRHVKGRRAYVIKGFMPIETGTFPVFMHITGNYCDYNAHVNLDFVRLMAEKGYVAASVDYDNGRFCPDICQESTCEYHKTVVKGFDKHDTNKDKFVTDGHHYFNNRSSHVYFGHVTFMEKAKGVSKALDVLCETSAADCSKGVAVNGFSQGSFVSSALALVDSRISALLLMGMGAMADWEVIDKFPWHELYIFKQHCIMDEHMSQHVPRTKRRYIDGSYDKFIGWWHKALQKYSGYKCENTSMPVDCIQPDGSGYYIVSPLEYTMDDVKEEHKYPVDYVRGTPLHRKIAGHNFFANTRPVENPGNLLPTYKNGNKPWCFHPSFSWLAEAARKPVDRSD